jgi:hypothetical protein
VHQDDGNAIGRARFVEGDFNAAPALAARADKDGFTHLLGLSTAMPLQL